MASDLYNLFVRLGADTSDYDRKLAKASNQLKQFGQNFSEIGQRLTFAVTAPLAGFGVAALVAAGKMEQTSVAFTTMMKSADLAGKHLEELKQFALKTPFQFTELTDASKRMMALGFSASDVIPKLTIIGNAVSGLGLGAEGLNRVVLAFGQMSAKGKVSAQEMNQLAEAGISAWDPLAKKLGIDIPTAMKKAEAGAISSTVAITAIMEGMEKRFAGGMEAQSKTLIGMWSNVKDAINFALIDIGKSLLPLGKDLIVKSLQPALDKVKELAAAFAKLDTSTQKVAIGTGAVVAAIPPLIWGLGITVTNATALATAFIKLKPVLAWVPSAVPWIALAAGIGYVLDKLADPKKIDTTAEAIKNLNKRLAEGAPSNTKFDTLMDFMKGGGPKAPAGTGTPAPTAPTADQIKALENAMDLFGLTSKKVDQYRDALALLHKEYKTGGLSLAQYTVALTKYWQEAAKLVGYTLERTISEVALEKGLMRQTQAQELAAAAVLKMQEASKPWGAQLEYQRAALDNLTTSMYAAWTAMQAGATVQLSVDWTKAAKGTTLETAMSPTSSVALRRQADAAAQEALRIRDMWQQNKATQEDYMRAQAAAAESERKATGAAKDHAAAISGQRTAAQEVDREVRRAFDNMARQMSKSIMEWKGWGEGLKNIAKDLAGGMLEIFIRGLFKPLENQIAKLAGKLADAISGALGGGASAAGGAASAAGGVASGAGSAASSAGGTVSGMAGSMATAWVGAISSAVSAVSGVISNFQFAAMNKTLDLIEHEVRYTQIHTLNILEKINAYLPKLDDLMGYMWTAQFPLLVKSTYALESGKGGGGVTININGAGDPRAVAQEVAKALRLQVPSMAFA